MPGSVASNSDSETAEPLLSESPVERRPPESNQDIAPMNGHPHVRGVDPETFVQGHSKDRECATSTRRDDQSEHAEDEEEDGEEDDDDDDEDDEEPALKYERLGGAAADLLEKDTASAVAVSQKVLVSVLMKALNICTDVTRRYWGRTAAWCTSWTI